VAEVQHAVGDDAGDDECFDDHGLLLLVLAWMSAR